MIALPPDQMRGLHGGFARLQAHWVYGAGLIGLALWLSLPLWAQGWPPGAKACVQALAIYMVHQWEEHDDDRFRRFIGEVMGDPDALTLADVFWINVVGVWGGLTLALALTLHVSPGWAIVAPYLLLVNAAAHIGQALHLRRANPGLWTALALFVPYGLWQWWHLAAVADLRQHGLMLGLVIALHGAILLRAKSNIERHRG